MGDGDGEGSVMVTVGDGEGACARVGIPVGAVTAGDGPGETVASAVAAGEEPVRSRGLAGTVPDGGTTGPPGRRDGPRDDGTRGDVGRPRLR